MPRRPRDTHAGVFHVTTHAVREEQLFENDRDRVQFLRELARAGARVGWTCVAYCLMGTHFHLILDVDDGALPCGMHALNFRYASWFNVEHGLRGHVMAARYWSRRVEDESDLQGTFRYVARNPVAAGVCREPGDWLWSSYPGTVGLRAPDDFVEPELVLECFAGPLDVRRAHLRRWVEAAEAVTVR
jgi:REP element-mobilizing transposase RayT